MKLSAFILRLIEILNRNGDMEVFHTQDWSEPVKDIFIEEEDINDKDQEYWPKRVSFWGGKYPHKDEYKKRKSGNKTT